MRTTKSFLAACLVAAIAVSACGSDDDSGGGSSTSASGGSGGGKALKVAFLLPETKVARYESKDKPYFQQKLKELCPNCKFLYANANSDAAQQNQQANSMLTQGANVLVVDPYDGEAAASIVNAAKSKNVPVVAYDRLISSPDLSYVISNDYFKVGQLQGKALVDKLKKDGADPSKGGILMMNGDRRDNNAGNIKRGALSVIDKSGYKVLASIDTWDPAEAQKWMAGQATKYKGKILGVYSANDGNAGGAIAALKAANVNPIPPMTGLDASVEGLQAILKGDQYMTTYNAFKSEAYTAAEVALALAKGQQPKSNAKVDGHPASLNPPVAVMKDNIKKAVIDDGFYKPSEICTPAYKDECQSAGIM
jgi:D-xylose transport system substrate-binding protein